MKEDMDKKTLRTLGAEELKNLLVEMTIKSSTPQADYKEVVDLLSAKMGNKKFVIFVDIFRSFFKLPEVKKLIEKR
jgi:hypothetical protein